MAFAMWDSVPSSCPNRTSINAPMTVFQLKFLISPSLAMRLTCLRAACTKSTGESLRGDRLHSRESQDPRDPAADSGKTLLAGVLSQLGMRKNAPNKKKRARGLGKPRARVAAIEVWVFGGGEQPLKRIVVKLFLVHAFGATPTSSRHLKDTLETPRCRIHGKKYLCFCKKRLLNAYFGGCVDIQGLAF